MMFYLKTCSFEVLEKPWVRRGSFVWPETEKRGLKSLLKWRDK